MEDKIFDENNVDNTPENEEVNKAEAPAEAVAPAPEVKAEEAKAEEVNAEEVKTEAAPQEAKKEEAPAAESGEYRYKPPYTTYGSNCPPPPPPHFNPNNMGNGEMPPPPPHMPPHMNGEKHPPKPPKKPVRKIVGRSFSNGAIAALILGCVLLSFGAGFAGAFVAGSFTGVGTGSHTDEELVIYKSVAITDEDEEPITDELTISQVEEIVADSVVEITTEFLTSYGPFQYVNEGAGSGVIISDNGYVITNNHVITGNEGKAADTITVRLKNTVEYQATLIGADSESDIALLKIDAEDLTYAVVGDSDKLKVGQSVIAVGNPLGELGGTVTSGIVSATGRTINVDGSEMKLIQIDAAVNPGNSGGGLFNRYGELVGIVNAKSTGTGIEGLGFAIPVNDAVNVADQLKTNGYVTGRTFIGVTFVDITDPYTAYRYFGTQSTGVYVYSLVEGYNEGTLKSGDRIVAVDGAEITASEEIKTLVKAKEVGDTLKFTIYRDGVLEEIEVTCYEYVPESAVDFSQQ